MRLLIESTANLDTEDRHGCTALYLAVERNMYETVELLCENYAYPSGLGIKSPIGLALEMRNFRLVDLLLDQMKLFHHFGWSNKNVV